MRPQRDPRRRLHEAGPITPVYLEGTVGREPADLSFQDPIIAVGAQKIRELVGLSRFAALQATGAVGYFSQHLWDLRNAPDQQLLADLLFEPGVLEENLQLDSYLAANLANFSMFGLNMGTSISLHFKAFFAYLSRSLSCTLDNIKHHNTSLGTSVDAVGTSKWAHRRFENKGGPFWDMITKSVEVRSDTAEHKRTRERQLGLISYYRAKSFENCASLGSKEDAADFAAAFSFLNAKGISSAPLNNSGILDSGLGLAPWHLVLSSLIPPPTPCAVLCVVAWLSHADSDWCLCRQLKSNVTPDSRLRVFTRL